MGLRRLLRLRRSRSPGAIPRIIHQFWDTAVPPDDVVASMQTWRDCHPDWRHILWNDATAAAFLSENFGREAALCFLSGVLPAMRSDVARLGILLVHGGVYVDAAFSCVRPIDELAEGYGILRVGPATRMPGAALKLSNGFIAAQPGSVLVKHAWRTVQRNIRDDPWNLQVSNVTGPGMLTDVWHNKLSPRERARYTLITKDDFALFAVKNKTLGHRSGEAHWVREIRKRQIINPKRAERELMALETEAARQRKKSEMKAARAAAREQRARDRAARRSRPPPEPPSVPSS